ncbi:hypothetical protein HF086_004697 [Spodoptera exigua]|uniref:DRBM domain-containing protein n=1 Tax=Spodoptera exigua TaxID=7107 RepID=A0A922M7V1_SPOEX|nr:hypothetical protein HF086_004697 [Spodoptera exigua]
MGAHGQALGGLGAMGVPPPHHTPQRPPHPIRAMPHHPQAQHHSVPPQQMKALRRPYAVSGGYGPGAAVMPPPYAQPPPMQPPAVPIAHTVVSSAARTAPGAGAGEAAEAEAAAAPAPEQDDARGASPRDSTANSKEKTPMCLVNELARYNKIKHQYRLTSETGPAHKKVFTVTLRLGDTEEYTAEGSSIKRAQHAAAQAALGGTSFPPPPPRAPAPHAAHHSHHRHAGAVMPTVELNALAMKLCQPAVYTSIPPVAGPARLVRARAPAYRAAALLAPAYAAPALLYRVRVCVGGRAWLGEGATRRRRATTRRRALRDLRPAPAARAAARARHRRRRRHAQPRQPQRRRRCSEVKSPVSLVHELALKRNLSVQFTVKSERGPPHMRVFVTACTVGDMETEGEGNGKKVSKRRAAERMLDEMRRRWPPALLRARPPQDKRRTQPAKKKPRNLIKVSEVLVIDVLLAMEMSSKPADATQNSCSPDTPAASPDSKNGDTKRKSTSSQDGDATGEVRQPVPGVLLMDYHQRTGQPVQPNGVSETSATGGSGGNTPGAKDQLMYLSQLLGFSVQFSDFPKRNHGEYLSLVSLSTEPPVMCHGGGPSTAHSHEQCSRAALRALTLMGLDAPTHPIQSVNSTPAKTSVVSNGIAE